MNRKISKAAARVLVVMALAASVATQTPTNAAANLVLNPGFETSYLPGQVVRDVLLNQPVWPTGWLAEGATALFDHSPHNPHSGRYSAQVSGSYSGPRRDCSLGSCTTIPGGEVKDALYQHYTLAPAWRTDLPISVAGGKSYTFSTWMRLSIPKDGAGAVTAIRWFDALGAPIRTNAGPKLTATVGGSNYLAFVNGTFKDQSTDWVKGTATISSPGNAASAVLVLGATDDAWIGSVAFDDVCLALSSTGAC